MDADAGVAVDPGSATTTRRNSVASTVNGIARPAPESYATDPSEVAQLGPARAPIFVKENGMEAKLNRIATLNEEPWTVTVPLDGVGVYFASVVTTKRELPFGSENEIRVDTELSSTPPRVTDQLVPKGRPTSVNTTEYTIWEYVTETVLEAPTTVTEPEAGDGVNPETALMV
jgi:hypothetical protein